MTDTAAPTDRQVADAIHWLVRFESGEVSSDERAAFGRWQAQSPQHALAWERLGRASRQFAAPINGQSLSSQQALHSLDAAERRLREKRRTLKTLASVAGLGLTTWLTRDYTGVATGATQAGRYLYGQALADVTTGVGEQQSIHLQDGGQLLLNTQSAMDIDFKAQPELVLHYGELAIANSGGAKLRAGNMLFSPATGSEFTLYRQDGACTLRVVAGRVDCLMAGGQGYQVAAGHSLSCQHEQLHQAPLDAHSLSWRQGLITVERGQLGEVIAQLARYRPGYLGCADEIAGLTLSGSFPVADTDAVLDNLCRSLPIRQRQLSRYWVRLMPA